MYFVENSIMSFKLLTLYRSAVITELRASSVVTTRATRLTRVLLTAVNAGQ